MQLSFGMCGDWSRRGGRANQAQGLYRFARRRESERIAGDRNQGVCESPARLVQVSSLDRVCPLSAKERSWKDKSERVESARSSTDVERIKNLSLGTNDKWKMFFCRLLPSLTCAFQDRSPAIADRVSKVRYLRSRRSCPGAILTAPKLRGSVGVRPHAVMRENRLDLLRDRELHRVETLLPERAHRHLGEILQEAIQRG